MRRKLSICLLSAALLVGSAGCGGSAPSQTPTPSPSPAAESEAPSGFDTAALEADAVLVANALREGKFEDVTAKFDQTMSAALDSATLSAGWKTAVSPLGEYVGPVSVEGGESGEYYAVDVTEEYGSSGVLIHVVYNASGQISGLYMTNVSLSAPATSDLCTQEPLTVAGDPSLPLDALLTLPIGVENPPVVILVHGSGTTDKDETIYANKPFEDLAIGLAEQGIASLRYDKRFYANPEAAPAMSDMTLRDEVLDDVSAAIALMEGDSRVDGNRVYVLGHSLGGMLTPAIAVEHPELAGVISLAGSLRPLWEIVYDQNMAALSGIDMESLSESDKALLSAQTGSIEANIATLRGDMSDVSNDTLLLGISAGYWKSLDEYQGMNFIQNVSMPILVLQGGADFQVYADRDYTLWQTTLAGRENVEFHLYDGLNHLFMPSQGKSDASEYQTAGHVEPQVIDDIAAFVSAN